MKKISLIFCSTVGIMNPAVAETTASHCTGNENTVFTCNLNNKKVVSLCSTKKASNDSGYLQFRFGEIGKIQLFIPKSKSGIPKLSLLYTNDKFLEINKVAIINEPFTYAIESYRQLKKTNKDGYPTTKSSDALNVTDSRKTVWEGNITYSSNCSKLGSKINAVTIAKLTGIKVEKVLY
ncbi:MAG: hypothetical protein NTV00_01335 [Methylococcales bacterium]|nr:hypothetical protein [Methylococcales bacterium]